MRASSVQCTVPKYCLGIPLLRDTLLGTPGHTLPYPAPLSDIRAAEEGLTTPVVLYRVTIPRRAYHETLVATTKLDNPAIEVTVLC